MIAELIPARYRRAIYTTLATAFALEGIFDVVPEGAETKILAALAVLGFAMAGVNTRAAD